MSTLFPDTTRCRVGWDAAVGSGEVKARSVVRSALQHPGQNEADHRRGADRDCRALLDEVARRARQFVEILLVERRGEASDGRSGRTRLVAVLLAEFGFDGVGAIIAHLCQDSHGLAALVPSLCSGISPLCRSLYPPPLRPAL